MCGRILPCISSFKITIAQALKEHANKAAGEIVAQCRLQKRVAGVEGRVIIPLGDKVEQKPRRSSA